MTLLPITRSMLDAQNHPILYSFRRCPYAMRARLALAVSGVHFELREVVLRNKPTQMLEASPKGTVPVLITKDGVIDESLDIMFWALEQNDPLNWLGKDEFQQTKAMQWIDQMDNAFKPKLDRYKYFERYEHSQAQYREESLPFIEELNNALQSNTYLMGDSESIADMALLPFIRQYAHVDKQWFFANEFTCVQAWLNNFLESALFQHVMPKYPAWSEGDEPVYWGV